jgi:hypothetical protein
MRQIILSNRIILVDSEDYEKVTSFTWRLQKYNTPGKFRVITGARKTQLYLHHLILPCPTGYVIDHINGNGLDNRKENLRICTNQENSFNHDISKNNTSGYTGVSLRKKSGKFRAYIHHNRKYNYLGDYITAEKAALAYNAAAIKYFGIFARLNKIKNRIKNEQSISI